VPKLRKAPRASKADKSSVAVDTLAAAADSVACLHCGHVNAFSGGRRPGKTVSCKLCGRMFSLDAAAVHKPAPAPEPPPPPPMMTPHAPDTESVDAVATSATLIYTPPPKPKKRTSTFFRVTLFLTILVFLAACGAAATVMVPQYVRTRAAASRAACAANITTIAHAVERYTHANGGAFPPSLERLVAAEKVPADAFVCPAGGDTPAPGATAEARAANLYTGGHLSYVYLGRGMSKRNGPGAGASAVVLYEQPHYHADGIHVLFVDGHVAYVPQPDAQKLITDVQTGKNPPEVAGY
jgi:prepilin-type processing-associated H-X9-DG protein